MCAYVIIYPHFNLRLFSSTTLKPSSSTTSNHMPLNPIACEHCRAKKCKCDRKLPSCSQCQSGLLACRYIEGGKRGIPAAYITSLERRLVETEAALYAALAALDTARDSTTSEYLQLHVNSSTSRLGERSKLERQSEWKRLPLESGEQLDEWFREKKSQGEYGEQDPFSPFTTRSRPQISQTGDGETPEKSTQELQHTGAAPPSLSTSSINRSEALVGGSLHMPNNSNTPERDKSSAQWRNYF